MGRRLIGLTVMAVALLALFWVSPAGARELVDGLPATHIATALMGDAIASNMFLLGYAWQRGWVPVSQAALDHAIELNGVSVDFNRSSFLWGRRAAHDQARVEALARPSNVLRFVPSNTKKTADLIETRAKDLSDYQNAAYAARYCALVDRLAGAEHAAGGTDRLTRAVARYYYKLLAYKDEFEVSRLYARPEFREQLEKTFSGDYKLHFHIGAWPFATRDPNTGLPRKREIGSWALSAFQVLARLRFLRGSMLDPFRRTAERRHALRDIADYESDIERLLVGLTAQNLNTAVAIAELPELIRGYGYVRERGVEKAAQPRQQLWREWNGESNTMFAEQRPLQYKI